MPEGVMSHNSHVTLLTNLGQFPVPSHLSHPITLHQVPYQNLSSPEHAQSCISHIHLFGSQSVLLFYISVPNYCPLLSHYCFFVQIIVLATLFKNTSMSLVVFNCILILVVLELQQYKGSNHVTVTVCSNIDSDLVFIVYSASLPNLTSEPHF